VIVRDICQQASAVPTKTCLQPGLLRLAPNIAISALHLLNKIVPNCPKLFNLLTNLLTIRAIMPEKSAKAHDNMSEGKAPNWPPLGGTRRVTCGGAPVLEHDPEKWKPVFRKDHAQTKS
jgi:hypothetical protein